MSALDMLAEADRLICSAQGHGEPVLLPSGEVHGVFSLFDPPVVVGSEVGLVFRPSQQPNPRLWLQEADAAGLREGDAVTVRGDVYHVTRIDADGSGLRVLSLAPARMSGTTGVWR